MDADQPRSLLPGPLEMLGPMIGVPYEEAEAEFGNLDQAFAIDFDKLPVTYDAQGAPTFFAGSDIAHEPTYAEWAAFKWARSQPDVQSTVIEDLMRRLRCRALGGFDCLRPAIPIIRPIVTPPGRPGPTWPGAPPIPINPFPGKRPLMPARPVGAPTSAHRSVNSSTGAAVGHHGRAHGYGPSLDANSTPTSEEELNAFAEYLVRDPQNKYLLEWLEDALDLSAGASSEGWAQHSQQSEKSEKSEKSEQAGALPSGAIVPPRSEPLLWPSADDPSPPEAGAEIEVGAGVAGVAGATFDTARRVKQSIRVAKQSVRDCSAGRVGEAR